MEPELAEVEPDSVPAVAVPRPAATVVLLRPGLSGLEVLLTQRPSTMAFGPNLHVFPGGAVDSGDRESAAAIGATDVDDAEWSAARVAAVRELWEEAGVALVDPPRGVDAEVLARAREELLAGTVAIGDISARLGLALRTDRLVPLSRWVTPPFVPRRFAVRFFVAELPPDAEPTFASSEVVAHCWLTPRAALDAMARGEIELWIPTSATLQQLEHVTSIADVSDVLAPGPTAPIRLDEVVDHVIQVVLPNAGGIAGQSVNAWVVGRRQLIVVDPGDPSEAAMDALLAISDGRGGSVVGVAITHAEPDHAAGAEALALQLGVPLFAGRGAGHDLPAEVHELDDGDRLPVGDVELVALATPGPRRDHCAWVAPELGAVLTGDLVGPGPSRSILGPPDVGAWLASLDRVASLAARRLLPGHGEIPTDPVAAIDTQRRRLPPA